MTPAYVIVTILSIATLTFSVAADIFLPDQVKANMDRAGVPRSWLPALLARWYAIGYPAVYLTLAAGSLVLNVAS